MFRQLIRQLRLAKGLTLEQVAQELGVTRASVSKWEGGHSRPDQARLKAIADLFEVSAAYLLGLASANPPKEYTVIELVHGVGLETLLNVRADVESYPSTCEVGEDAFFVRLDNDTLGGWGLGGVTPGSILLVDPAREPRSGDVVMTKKGTANYSFMAVNIIEGVRYCSYLGEKYARMAPTRNPKVVGVVVEAVKVTPMLGYAHKMFPNS